MMDLLKIEWLKVRRYRTFIVFLSLFVVSVFGVNYIFFLSLRDFSDSISEINPAGGHLTNTLIGHPFAFPEVWQTVTYLCSFLLGIPGLIIILLTANEYGFRTHRQAVINGWSRTEFVKAKIGLIFAIAVGLTLLVAAIALLFGIAGGTAVSFQGFRYIGYFFTQSVSYMSVALVVVMLFRRSGLSIGMYALYILVLEKMVGIILNRWVVEGSGNFLPVRSADKLIPAPTEIGRIFSTDLPDTNYFLVTAVVWIGLCLWFCLWRFRSSDL